jgi:V/A-type H+-transporting ATPase subunit I
MIPILRNPKATSSFISPLAMKHVTLQILTADLPAVSLILAELGVFNPDDRDNVDDLPERPGRRYRELYHQARARLEKIAGVIELPAVDQSGTRHPIEEGRLEAVDHLLGEAWQVCSEYEEQRRIIQDERHSVEQLQNTLNNFHQLKVDLGLLQEQKRFLDIHIGTVPQEHVNQLRDALGLDGYLLFTYMVRSPHAHVVILGPGSEQSPHLRSVLDTAGYRSMEIPADLRARPEEAASQLQSRRQALQGQESVLAQRFGEWRGEAETALLQAARTLWLAAPFVALGEVARNRGSLSQVRGWAAAEDVALIESMLRGKLRNPLVLETRDPYPEERPLVPSLLRHNRLLQPFAFLVSQYGVPRYGELNPTLLFAITFIGMFGMMFGDLGHGAVILLAGLLARRRLGRFTFFAVAAGVSSMLFGLLYGSLFGYEHILHPLWISPLSDPITMLTAALIWGAGFLVMTALLNIANHLLAGDRSGALFAHNGLLNLLFYAGLLGMGFSLNRDGEAGGFWVLLASLALSGLFVHSLSEDRQSPWGERLLVALIGTLETVIGYVSNTLSFLRVAAFSLNHVALAIAVFTLANLMGEVGHWLMVVFGNLFILVLEGAIVTIQALRLEYYEGFTRFYAGDGRAFRALKL